MKLYIYLAFVLLHVTSYSQNSIKAKLEFENAESAFSQNNYEDAVSKLNEVETLLGKWTPKVSFLKIVSLNQIVQKLNSANSQTELRAEVDRYMKFYKSNHEDIVEDKFKIVYEIEKEMATREKLPAFLEMPEYINGLASNRSGNYEAANLYFQKAVVKNNPYAMLELAHNYKDGNGVRQDYVESLRLFRMAFDKGVAAGANMVGVQYQAGHGVETNHDEAFNWYLKAANSSDAAGMANLGHIYYNGSGRPKNYSEAIKWYLKAADADPDIKPPAANRIADIYYKGGFGIEQNFETALEYFELSGENGYLDAMASLSGMYYHGKGTSINYDEAFRWAERAAQKGHVLSMAWLGFMYADQRTGRKNEENAFFWNLKAAESGYHEVMGKVAYAYKTGRGVRKDREQYEYWTEKAKSKK